MTGKTGWLKWVAFALPFAAFLAWSFSLAVAAEETFDGDATTVNIRMNCRYIKNGVVEGGRDTTAAAFAGQYATGLRGILYGNLTSIPAGSAILRAHIKVVAHKSLSTTSLAVYRTTATSDSAAVTWKKRTAASNWATAGAGTYIDRFDANSAYGDTMFTSTSYDRMRASTDRIFNPSTVTIAGETIRLDVTRDVRVAYSNGVIPSWIVMTEDTTGTGEPIRWGTHATAADRPTLEVVYGPVNPAVAAGDTIVASRMGRFGSIERGYSPQ